MIGMSRHVAEYLMGSNGIDVSKYDDAFLGKSLQKRMAATHCVLIEEYCDFLGQSQGECTAFVDSLHINYSEFFRNPLTFAVLEQIILPAIVLKNKTAKRKEIRIWSAACAGGQEAYSLAILLEELRNGHGTEFTYRIFATDQCESQIHEALKGQYSAAALKNMSLKRAEEWFTRRGDLYAIKPEMKEHMDFSTFDLFNEQLSCPPASIFGDFDLVLCSNLLFYYKNRYQKIVLGKTENALIRGGYLVTGEAERNILMKQDYQEVFPQSAIFQV
jgi:chemotaxis methyl-accepting protein methylase